MSDARIRYARLLPNCSNAPLQSYLKARRRFLDKYHQAGSFLLSGGKEPRSGGIILATSPSHADIEALLGEDPFYQARLAEYHVTEFVPNQAAAGLERFLT